MSSSAWLSAREMDLRATLSNLACRKGSPALIVCWADAFLFAPRVECSEKEAVRVEADEEFGY